MCLGVPALCHSSCLLSTLPALLERENSLRRNRKDSSSVNQHFKVHQSVFGHLESFSDCIVMSKMLKISAVHGGLFLQSQLLGKLRQEDGRFEAKWATQQDLAFKGMQLGMWLMIERPWVQLLSTTYTHKKKLEGIPEVLQLSNSVNVANMILFPSYR